MRRPVSRRHWVRLDNASNIFPAARSDVDPKVFRMSAEMDHEVDPALLQEALDETFARFPLYHAVLRRGVFWYYLQDSDLLPVVEAETEPSCAPIYQPDRRTLLFRVLHHRRRISLEIFHALSDGTGALWFLTDLLTGYSRRRFPQEALPDAAADEVRPGAQERPDPPPEAVGARTGAEAAEEVHELTTDSFAHYFRSRRRRRRAEADHQEEFSREAAPAVLTVEEADAPVEEAVEEPPAPRPARRRIHRVRGTRTPDHRTRVIELTMPAKPLLGIAKSEGAALTMYLTALFFESIRRTDAGAQGPPTMAASVPVNLRQFFPSSSARNFFATIRVEHTYGRGDDSPGAVARALQESFSAEATPEALEQKLHRLLRVERLPLARIVPRPVKDLLLSLINHANNRRLTVAISNLGRVKLPEPAESHVGRMLFHVSAVRPQFCAMSHDGLLTLSFTAPFVETDHVREYAALLTEAGVDVTVSAVRASEDELMEFGT
ncbi:alcohol acetyltransferase [Brachybacterium sp. Z12]|uniref:alcohol acetyltransferase n=1 Tax=Brachybacterium sp. Z12 TaxID=2759167 RepID=UPI0018618090|nr:alcohol acetyltransferase [Brachybacterium sp. Z12]QNN82936.1 alcohol acetyltransferase [Brachybacterium sp. Z12]